MKKYAVLLFVALLFACSSKPEEKPKEVKSPALIAMEDARFKAYTAKLEKAQEYGLLYDMGWKDGKLMILVGQPFYRIPFDAKEGFAETLNGFLLVGEEGKHLSFDLRDYRTNEVVAEYRMGKLKMK